MEQNPQNKNEIPQDFNGLGLISFEGTDNPRKDNNENKVPHYSFSLVMVIIVLVVVVLLFYPIWNKINKAKERADWVRKRVKKIEELIQKKKEIKRKIDKWTKVIQRATLAIVFSSILAASIIGFTQGFFTTWWGGLTTITAIISMGWVVISYLVYREMKDLTQLMKDMKSWLDAIIYKRIKNRTLKKYEVEEKDEYVEKPVTLIVEIRNHSDELKKLKTELQEMDEELARN